MVMKNARFPLSSYQRQHTRAATLPKHFSCASDNIIVAMPTPPSPWTFMTLLSFEQLIPWSVGISLP